MKTLNLAPTLKAPVDLAAETTLVVGIRGSGKTNTAGVFAEELLSGGHPICVIDPTDAWWGLRSKWPVFIFGGSRADLPLQETDGKVIAEFLVAEQMPVIVSLRHLRKAAQRRFVTDFCEELYHLKGRPENRTALTVIMDEAPLFVPQKVLGEVARTVGAVEDLIARGRNAGIGVVLISQRFATVNKDVSTQAGTIIAHRLTAPQDRKALGDWVEENASLDELNQVLASLAGLRDGQAWVWSPRLKVFSCVQVRKRDSFDSSATPKPGQTIKAPRALTEIDLAALKGRLAASVDKARAEDPKVLQRRIAELEKQLVNGAAAKPETKIQEVRVVTGADVSRFERAIAQWDKLGEKLESFRGDVSALADALRGARREGERPAARPMERAAIAPVLVARPAMRPGAREESVGDVGLGRAERAILAVLAQFPGGCEAGKLTLLTGYRWSGGFRNALGDLRSRGLIEGGNTGAMRITAAGLDRGPFDPLPTGRALLDYWLAHPSFGKAERAILGALVDHPGGLTREQLCDATGYEFSGGFRNALGNLRRAGVMAGSNGGVMRPHDDLIAAGSRVRS